MAIYFFKLEEIEMIYVNDVLVTEEENQKIAEKMLKMYLTTEKLVLIREDNEIVDEQEIGTILINRPAIVKLKAIRTSALLRDFKEELQNYILRVEEYVEATRESEDFSMVMTSFVQVTEGILEFSAVAKFLQKDLIDQQQIHEITKKALQQAEAGNNEYLLDLLEYELIPMIYHFLSETIEEM